MKIPTPRLITISEHVWRTAASNHKRRVQSLLQPGLTSREEQINSGNRRRDNRFVDDWTALDPVNPIYNFLIEYYGIKGAKGPRRLARWSPDPALLLKDVDIGMNMDLRKDGGDLTTLDAEETSSVYKAAMKASYGLGGILLENANADDMGGTLHLRGCTPVMYDNKDDVDEPSFHGVLYNPSVFYNRHIPMSTDEKNRLLKTIAPFQWFSSILQSTLDSEPLLHCHGLHEWAMQYHPEGSPPPPSAKYQNGLPLRVSKEVINKTVERKGISCTHVDALRFFSPAAGPLNHHGSQLQRTDQLRLEQKACVHAHMDLLKIALKLKSFIDSDLLDDVLEISIEARRLDVEASPYDATFYGAGIVPVETPEGRKMYRERQNYLMHKAEPVRIRLLQAYKAFMELAFEDELLDGSDDKKQTKAYIAPERLAKAEPGGLPWKHNLIES